MKFLRLVWIHIKRLLQSYQLLIMLILVPLGTGLLIGFSMIRNPQMGAVNSQVVVQDANFNTEELVAQLPEAYQKTGIITTYEEAITNIEDNETGVFYVIPTGFQDGIKAGKAIPIEIVSLSGKSHDYIFEQQLLDFVKVSSIRDLFSDHQLDYQPMSVASPTISFKSSRVNKDMIVIIMIFFMFILMNAGSVSMDLADLRQELILKRSVVSANSSLTILGSVLVAYAVFTFLTYSLLFVLMTWVFELQMGDWPLVLAYTAAMVLCGLGLTMVFFRLFKDPALSFFLSYILAMASMGVLLLENIPALSSVAWIRYLSPMYWASGIDYGRVFPNIFIILLLGLIGLTAGSLKLENFADPRN